MREDRQTIELPVREDRQTIELPVRDERQTRATCDSGMLKTLRMLMTTILTSEVPDNFPQ